jgi:hypothetical protein
MVELLSTAKSYAAAYRFAGDQNFCEDGARSLFSDARDLLYLHELAISSHVTPGLERSITHVCMRLHLPRSCFDAFVYSSSEIQASCLICDSNRFIIRISSGLIDLLDDEEFKFVIGHEVAHFLYNHQRALSNVSESVEQYLLQRSQEISADRLGLISCDSVDVATRTLMKSLSGLSSKHLRFDIREFVNQIRRPLSTSNTSDLFSTHPSMVVRCRGLLWFSASDLISHEVSQTQFNNLEKEKLDRRIQNDLDRFVNASARKQIERARSDLSLWITASKVIEKGRFSKRDQLLIGEMFGQQTASSLRAFLSDNGPGEIESVAFGKLQAARSALAELIPYSFLKEYHNLENRIAGLLAP